MQTPRPGGTRLTQVATSRALTTRQGLGICASLRRILAVTIVIHWQRLLPTPRLSQVQKGEGPIVGRSARVP